MSEKKSWPELSVDTQALERALSAVSVAAEITYEELSKVIGRAVQNGARGLLTSARRRLLRDQRMVFGTIRGVGLKRLDDAGVVATSTQHIAHIRKTSRRAVRELAAISDYAALPNDLKIKHNAATSLLGVLAHVTADKTMRKLEGSVEKAQGALPLAKMLEAVKENL